MPVRISRPQKTHDTASAQAIFKVYLQNTANQSGVPPSFDIYYVRKLHISAAKKERQKERKKGKRKENSSEK